MIKNNSFTNNIYKSSYLSIWIGNIKRFFRNFKYSWQRIKYGVSEYDAIDLDSYMMTTFANGLHYLRKWGNSHPGDIDYEEWHLILSKMEDMAANYQKMSDSWIDCRSFEEMDSDMNAYLDEFSDLIRRHFTDLWD